MADEDQQESKVCTFTFKKRRAGGAMRRKANDEDDDKKRSSSEDETVVTRAEKKTALGVISAKTVYLQKSIPKCPKVNQPSCSSF